MIFTNPTIQGLFQLRLKLQQLWFLIRKECCHMKKIILAFSVMLLDCLWIVTSPHFGMNQIIGLIVLLGVTGYLLSKLQRQQ